ncbi:BZ3500_MvSof-1268-A1-R1_Chr1-2g01386 [Microbotryum saponariae]|uniref:BZ3500_MvSof-1268-A1-R1_Chr1-2g01386 protein n=1 Tax=Microbotryum saponariae TaxID=289078 RepID=A0A2X0L6K3_9BASI|nr:BZ3500_MvSof-1268-A1-R1_Chr1-2g01386 [Microbotryum saponariae]SCZ97275.1 BZ3501_MvSof-1269-A2-R1_Chr1-2g00985 [Microbotryum saponariae]
MDRPPMRFQPRQAHYLRVSPHTVLQFILYMEPGHAHWMTVGPRSRSQSEIQESFDRLSAVPQEDRLMRVLSALRERITTKLRNEQAPARKKSGGAREKQQIDVYRGQDYQMLFYFRSMGKRHVVLHKHERQRVYPIASMPPPPRPIAKKPPPPPPRASTSKRTRESASVDLTSHEDEYEDNNEEQPAKRSTAQPDLFIKDEDDEQDARTLLESAQTSETIDPKEDDKDDVKPDVKPEVHVLYKSYSIYNRALVVVIEPWPALSAADLPRPSAIPNEIRQLSATPLPERPGRVGSSSLTPAPPRRSGKPLFRSTTTPLEEDEEDEDEDEHMYAPIPGRRGGREDTVGSVAGSEVEDEDEGELPSLDELLGKR